VASTSGGNYSNEKTADKFNPWAAKDANMGSTTKLSDTASMTMVVNLQ